MGLDCLDMCSLLEFYTFFQNQKVQEIIMTIWKSKYSVEGTILDLSSNYQAITYHDVRSRVDYE